MKKITLIIVCFFLFLNVQAQDKKATVSNKDKKERTNDPSKTIQLGSPNKKQANQLKTLVNSPSSDYVITSEHVSSTSGTHHIYIRQAINGIGVIGTESSIHLDSSGKIIASHNKFNKNIQSTVKNSSATISETQAISSVAQQMGYRLNGLQQIENSKGVNRKSKFNKGGISGEDIPVKLLYYYREGYGTTLIWELSIMELDSSDWWNFRVDASTGQIIDKDNFTVSCFDEEYEFVTANEKEPAIFYTVAEKPIVLVGSYNVIPLPIESPNHGGRSVVANPDNALASPYGWHDTNGVAGAESNYTIGNNTDAYDDRSSTTSGTGSGVNSERAFGGAGLIFNDPFNTNVTAGGTDGSIDAAVTNLFYWANIVHDVMYQYGFDEASGNFQVNNYGNGGVAGDSVRSEAQDGSGTCNANFSTPTDGGRGRMQMYVCGTRDGDFDNGVIIHEYGHGISTRLTGGAGNSGCLNNTEQMGEGWSDFFGLVMTLEPGDSRTDSRGMGTWLVGEPANGPGIRTYPYSTDFAVNPHTYDDIKTEVAPHGVGSVWAAMVWEMTWDLIDVYGFDTDVYTGSGGNNIALALVTEGLKLQPCSPGFIDGRDAILAADNAIYGGANQCIIWEAFARRGLGFSATQGSTSSKTDGVEAFDLPPGTATFTNSIASLCVTQGVQTSLGGGTPTGGTYSGTGVTDDGNGTTYTFDPAVAGVGIATVTYNVVDSCTGGAVNLNETIDVTDGLPILVCQDATVTLDGGGNASITWPDVVSNSIPAGYTYGAVTFAPETMTGAATSVTLADDNGTSAIPLGFNFDFYNTTYSSFYIASNGFVSFTGTGMTGAASYSPTAIPNSAVPNGMIAVVWDDLSPNNGGTVKYQLFGTAPNRKMVVEYNAVPLYSATETVTAQAHIYEGTNVIEVHFIDAQNNGGSRTFGIENETGTIALTDPATNLGNWTVSNFAAAFTPQPDSFADNCGNTVTVTVSQSDFTCVDVGTNTVTITADDGNGGISYCQATVTVLGTSCAVTVSPKVFLQGAAINPNTGEELLMRDDLRVGTILPTTSPYGDGAITDILNFNLGGYFGTGTIQDDIVDWVLVELRDAADNTIIIDTKVGLLQRDGDVVAIDGISPIRFTQSNGNYYVSVNHRTHTGILSANTFNLSATNTVVDFTTSDTSAQGGSLALTLLTNGKYAAFGGDFNNNGQIQTTDVSGVTNLLGSSGYSDADLNMNGQVQTTDINNIIYPNIGKGQQF